MRILDWTEAEMLFTLWHLRYLTSEQLLRWYPGRSLESCVKRLSRLHGSRIVERVVLHAGQLVSAWRVGVEGYRYLRQLGHEVDPTKPLSSQFVPHLLLTNRVFEILAGDELCWDRLAFAWSGSHHVALEYSGRGARLGDHQRRVLRPDAMVVPRGGRPGPRVFVELDRSTECISPKDGRRSITGKLHSYSRFLRGIDSATRQTWYAKTFPDRREPRVLFVLARVDNRARDPKQRDRRMRAIERVAAEVARQGADVPLACAYLDDVVALRSALMPRPGARPVQAPEPSVAPSPASLSPSELELIARFYRWSFEAHRRLATTSRVRQPLAQTAHKMKQLVLRLRPEAAPMLLDFVQGEHR